LEIIKLHWDGEKLDGTARAPAASRFAPRARTFATEFSTGSVENGWRFIIFNRMRRIARM
jgi:hypothetical protein